MRRPPRGHMTSAVERSIRGAAIASIEVRALETLLHARYERPGLDLRM